MINFSKMSGSGNDFILIDNFSFKYDVKFLREITPYVCRRGMSLGSDGLIIIEPDNNSDVDFIWHFFNADGSIASMCGNGARCAARFAYLRKRAPKKMVFRTGAGNIEGEILDDNEVRIKLTKAENLKLDVKLPHDIYKSCDYVFTGTQHAVIMVDNINDVDVLGAGRAIRQMKDIFPNGTNVNFFQKKGSEFITRTYEKGVEEETLACGTGNAAVAYTAVKRGLTEFPVRLLTRGGKILTVSEENESLYLKGEARLILDGVLYKESYQF